MITLGHGETDLLNKSSHSGFDVVEPVWMSSFIFDEQNEDRNSTERNNRSDQTLHEGRIEGKSKNENAYADKDNRIDDVDLDWTLQIRIFVPPVYLTHYSNHIPHPVCKSNIVDQLIDVIRN